jgi:hypothetical protein
MATKHDDIRSATRHLVEAALAWADRDYGDPGELEADAALNDAVRHFKRVADRADSRALDLLFRPTAN